MEVARQHEIVFPATLILPQYVAIHRELKDRFMRHAVIASAATQSRPRRAQRIGIASVIPSGSILPQGCVDSGTGWPGDRDQISRPERAPMRPRRAFTSAMVSDASGAHHRVFALSLRDGSVLPGWPIDVAEALAARGRRFDTRVQGQR